MYYVLLVGRNELESGIGGSSKAPHMDANENASETGVGKRVDGRGRNWSGGHGMPCPYGRPGRSGRVAGAMLALVVAAA